MSAAPAPSAGPAAKKRGKLPLVVVAAAALAGGAVLPLFVAVPGLSGKKAEAKPKSKVENTVAVPVGDVTVNIADPSPQPKQAYMRMKLALKVDAEDEKAVTALVTKNKVAMKSKLISYLLGKSVKDLKDPTGMHKVQREVLERFDDILYPDGESKLRDVLFEEYVIQQH